MGSARVNVGLVGLGAIGGVHLRNLATRVLGARLVAVADALPERVAAAEWDYEVKGYPDYREFLRHPGLDAVVIAAPSDVHAEITIAAAREGKAVFCEKPIALTVAGALEAAQAVEKAGVPFQIGFMRRYDPGYAAAREAIERGVIGEVRAFNGIDRDPTGGSPSLWAREGDMHLASLIHDFDVARFLVGFEITRVYSRGRDLVHGFFAPRGDVDHTYIILDFAGGALGHIEGSHNAMYGYDIRAEVMGTKGTIQVGMDRYTPVRTLTLDGVVHDHIQTWPQRFAQAYEQEMVAFADSVREGRQPTPGLEEAIRAVLVAVACRKSQDEDRPVEIASLLPATA